MNKFNYVIAALAITTGLAVSTSAVAASRTVTQTESQIENQATQPHLIVKQAAEATFAKILEAKNAELTENKVYKNIMEDELMPIVSYQFAAYKVLGKHARTLSKEELREFVDVFRDYLLGNYAALLNDYDGQQVEFLPVTVTSKSKEVGVKGIMKNENGPDTNFVFKMRKMRSGEWKVYDIIAEGISMVDAKRSEFSPIIRTEGVNALILKLKEISAA
jgi:phospholipid transport system substrate-binding protein